MRRFYEPAIEGIADSGIAVEVSTAGLRKPAGEIYPARAFLEMCVEAGASFALSSDAHSPQDIGAGYEQALALLDAVGVRELCVFERRERAPRGDRRDVSALVGIGFDSHRLVEGESLVIGGVEIPHERGLEGHSDADVLAHAITDAILGAAAMGDIGEHFPDSDERYAGADSIGLLETAVQMLAAVGFEVRNVDCTLLLERPKILPLPQRDPGAPRLGAAHPARAREREGEHGRGDRLRGARGGRGGARSGVARAQSMMHEVRLHDTRSGELQPLRPHEQGHVGIYACGPTVYGRIHLGNARPFVIFSLMKRFLEHEGLSVTLVVNVTDVNDKIYEAAQAAGVGSEELAREMTAAYVADTDALGLGRPDEEPLASQTMAQIIAYIEALVDSEHAYAVPYAGADGEQREDVYFRVRSDPEYGSLSHRRVEDMDQGEGVEGTERKRDPLDFALWKAHKQGEDTAWPSPWGAGRPGWHIECSAMAEDLSGLEFDIHGGGSDLVFPHHENEAAQTRAARGRELAKLWVHNGMIQSTGEKMAKSVGNIAPLAEVLERYGRDAVVMYLVSGHYRQPLAFSEAALGEAEQQVLRIREALRRLPAGARKPARDGAPSRGVLRGARGGLQHPEGACVALRVGPRGQPPRASARRSRPARDAGRVRARRARAARRSRRPGGDRPARGSAPGAS